MNSITFQSGSYIALMVVTLTIGLSAHAAPAKKTAASGKVPGQYSKKLDFDGATVEALNRRPMDSFNQISDKDKGPLSDHLYKKRANFDDQSADTLLQLRNQ